MREKIKKIPPLVKKIADTLIKAGFEAYFVGGCVRSMVLHLKPKDWDITTNAKPEEIQKLFPHSVYENKYGTVGVISDTDDKTLKVVEITPYRLESIYSDKRRPDEVRFTSNIEEDLKRRDFTINALALALPAGKAGRAGKNGEDYKLIDLFGGQNDLENKIIRAVGEPDTRFNEDALRMLRAVRLATELDFEIEPNT